MKGFMAGALVGMGIGLAIVINSAPHPAWASQILGAVFPLGFGMLFYDSID